MWQKNVTNFLQENDFKSTSDPLLFIKQFPKKNFIIISLHVDDFLVISTKEKYLQEFQAQMQHEYNHITVKHGPNLTYLGLSIQHDRENNTLSVSQPAYVDKIISKSGFNITTGTTTPILTTHNNPSKNDNIEVDKLEYMRLVGLLNYLAIYTRPDILYAMSIVSQASQHPSQADLLKVKRIFRYVFSTKNKCIIFKQTDNLDVICYVDASHNCYKDGKSHYSFLFSIGYGNHFFCVKSGKIKLVTLSSTESEYIALAFAVKEALYILRLLKDLNLYNGTPIKFFEDNEPVIKMLNADQLIHDTTKHINPKFHFTKDYFKKGIISIEKIDTKFQIADVLTKALAEEQFTFLSSKIVDYYN